MLDWLDVDTRRFVIVSILIACLAGPVVEMFDQWDRTYQNGNDTEANVVVVALCIGAAFAVAGVVSAKIRACSLQINRRLTTFIDLAAAPITFRRPVPTTSPPAQLRC